VGIEEPGAGYGGPLSFPNQPHSHPTPPSAGEALTATMGHNFVTTSVNKVVAWGRYNSMWPALFGLACCAIEMMGTGGPKFDMARFGAEVFRASPRQADLMIVAGRVSQKMAPVLRQIYDQMPEPKWVIAMGACASCGGMFNNLRHRPGGGQGGAGRCLRTGLPASPRSPPRRRPQASAQDPSPGRRLIRRPQPWPFESGDLQPRNK